MNTNKAEKKFVIPHLGKYNARFKLIEERIKGPSYDQSMSKTKSRRREVEQIANSIPIWDRVIRALNSYKNNELQNKITPLYNNQDIDYKYDERTNEDSNKMAKNNSMEIMTHNKSIPSNSRLSDMNKNTPK